MFANLNTHINASIMGHTVFEIRLSNLLAWNLKIRIFI